MISPEQAIQEADKALDRFLEGALVHDVRLMRDHGATDREVREFLKWKRDEYEACKCTALARLISFVTDRPLDHLPRLQ